MEEISLRAIILPQSPILAVWQGSEHASVSRSVTYLVQRPYVITISGILRTLEYSKLCLFRHIQAYSIVIKILSFFFYLYTFQRNLKRQLF